MNALKLFAALFFALVLAMGTGALALRWYVKSSVESASTTFSKAYQDAEKKSAEREAKYAAELSAQP